MELIVGLIVLAAALAAVVAGLWLAARAFRRLRRRSGSPPAGPPVGVSVFRRRLEDLRQHGFIVEDGGRGKIVLRLPLLDARSMAGRAVEEYRVILKLDEESATARLSERRISKESGFGGAGLFRFSSWAGPTAGASDRKESGAAVAPGGAGGGYRLDAREARALVEGAITAAGWRVR